MIGLSIREYARRRGVSHVAVLKAINSGRISKLPNGRINPEAADAQWAARTRPRIDRPAAAGLGDESYHRARLMHTYYSAKLAQLDYEVRTGTLVRAEEVKRAAFQAARLGRDRLLSVPDRIALLLAQLSDPADCRQAVLAEVLPICDELEAAARRVPGYETRPTR